jgi:DNA-binding transcriptional MerR regulator
MKITVGKLAKKFGLSRSTLLYYDKIGLLSPAMHVKGEYRTYGEDEQGRLTLICRYRKAGIPLREIQKILDSPDSSFTDILHKRFKELTKEIAELHEQQKIIAGLLKNSALIRESTAMNKELWVSLLEAAGFSEKDMRKWHRQFERTAPDLHMLFLQQLHIPEDEIQMIRGLSKKDHDLGQIVQNKKR